MSEGEAERRRAAETDLRRHPGDRTACGKMVDSNDDPCPLPPSLEGQPCFRREQPAYGPHRSGGTRRQLADVEFATRVGQASSATRRPTALCGNGTKVGASGASVSSGRINRTTSSVLSGASFGGNAANINSGSNAVTRNAKERSCDAGGAQAAAERANDRNPCAPASCRMRRTVVALRRAHAMQRLLPDDSGPAPSGTAGNGQSGESSIQFGVTSHRYVANTAPVQQSMVTAIHRKDPPVQCRPQAPPSRSVRTRA